MKFLSKKSIRAVSSALVVCQLISAGAGAAFDSAFSYSYPVGEGTTYTRVEGKNSAGLQKANILTYAPNTTVTPRIVYASEQLYGAKATIMNAAKYMTNKNLKVIGGVNADFFVMSSGIPIGLVIDEGELISSDAWQYAVGFKPDGTAVTGRPTMSMKIAGTTGTVSVAYFNKTRTTAGIYLLDRNYDSSTHFSANGRNIILERIDDTPVTVGGTVKMKVINKGTGASPLTITENQMVLTQSDGAKGDWIDFAVGEEVTLTVQAADSAWRDVDYAVGGKLLLDNGTVTTSGIDAASSKTARSAIGVKADGTIILYEVDGLQSTHSAGLTAAELGNELKALGCVSAICLDGGGSSAMALRQPGSSDVSLITKPSDVSQRSCANYIFLINNAPSDGVTAHAILTPSYRYLLPGASTWFSVKGADSSYGPAEAPTDLSYTVSGDLGTVSGQTFTAGSNTGSATIKASSGSVSGEMTVSVTEDVNSIALSSGSNSISSVSLDPGKSIDLDATAYHQGTKMSATDDLFTWSVSGAVGTLDKNGVFQAGENMASGTLTCAYGATKKTINVSVGMGDAQQSSKIADFESAQPCTATDGVTLSTVSDYTLVGYGARSLKAAYDGTKVATATIHLPETDVSEMKYLSLSARSAGTMSNLTAVFADENGEELTAPLSAATTTSWRHLTTAVPEGAAKLVGIRVQKSGTGAANSALYLDQIFVSAHHAVTNTDAPALTLAKNALTVSAGASATVTGTATMESGKYPVRAGNITVKVDGKTVTGAAKMSGSALTVTTGALSAGTHCITIDATDDAGNRTRKSVTVTAGNASSPFSDTASHWAGGYASLLNTTGIMKGETQDGKTYFSPDRNLRRMEFAVTMARVLGLDTSYTGKLDFADDASIPSWARGAVYAVSKAGIMNGQKSGDKVYFAPSADMIRAEVMTVIGRSLPRGFAAASLSYTDASSVPSWATEQVKTCVSAGIIGGYADNTLKPLGNITRGEIAKILALL
ncbi:phosphodiester glycosidase family protein [Butyricicoccus sp. Marseille-Q5471]|uniref:phosphodiester glycosidase family protein n=1 Tax=Butyricicoccus sp. Marseille-Q5471 TaxID=3039493 RepID=UPI0024BC2145|nr:phosphodiester glycosidase family protein [Butyricicoccus sp. Marseille-Q5471]